MQMSTYILIGHTVIFFKGILAKVPWTLFHHRRFWISATTSPFQTRYCTLHHTPFLLCILLCILLTRNLYFTFAVSVELHTLIRY
jgi:hypothetical protein